MGTLIELASGTLDTLSHLIARPAGQALTMTSPTRPSERPLDVGVAMLATRQTVEAVLFYATTQLGAWVMTPEQVDSGAGTEVDVAEDAAVDLALITHGEQRRSSSRRESTVLTERMRRGLTGEISSELKAVLEKARNLFAKSQQTVGENRSTGDITNVLLGFLNQRVIGSG
jgi:nuclear pore complex protein Nup188